MKKYDTVKYEFQCHNFVDDETIGKIKFDTLSYIPRMDNMVRDIIKGKFDNPLCQDVKDGIYCNYSLDGAEWHIEKHYVGDEIWFRMDRFDSLSDKDWCEVKKDFFKGYDVSCDDATCGVEIKVNLDG